MKLSGHIVRRLLAAAAFSTSVLAWQQAEAASLEDVLEKAYNYSPELKSAQENLQATDELMAQAVSGFRPSLSAEYGRGRERTRRGNTDFEYQDTDNRYLTLSQPIFRSGGTLAGISNAKDRIIAERFRLLSVEQEVLLNAIVAYMDVVRDREVLALSRNNVNVLDKQLGATNERFDVGEVTRTDVSQARARKALSDAEFTQAQGNLESSIAVFYKNTGEYPPDDMTIDVPLPELPTSLEAATERALEQNPNLRRAWFTAEAAESEVDVNVSRLLPSVDLVGNMQRIEGSGRFGGGDFDNDALTLNVTIPLYQSGAQYSRVRQAKQVVQQRKYDLMSTRNTVQQDVKLAWERYVARTAAIESTQVATDAASVALEGVRQEEQYGARTILDVLDAEQEYFQAQVNLVRAKRDQVVAAYNLLLIMGDLTAPSLGLDVEHFDPTAYYEDIRYQPAGF